MRRFWRIFFGLNGTDDRLRQHAMAYGVLTVLWAVLLGSRLVQPSPFGPSHLLLTILPIILVVFCGATAVSKLVELRRRHARSA